MAIEARRVGEIPVRCRNLVTLGVRLGGESPMFKVRRFVCLALVCVMAGIAYAGATKIRSFTTFNEPAEADGMAIINVAQGQGLVVQLILTGFSPNTSYVQALYDDASDSEYNAFGEFFTDDNGHANLHFTVSTLAPWPNLRLYHCVGDVNPVCELRAQGIP